VEEWLAAVSLLPVTLKMMEKTGHAQIIKKKAA
jgi:hypothetical protein